MKNLLFTILFSFTFFTSTNSQAAVWQAENQWDQTWENKYRDWVLMNWTSDYFTKPGPFQNLKLDCADAAYSMRLIYSYTAKLPFVVNDPTGGPKLISQEMSRWDGQPEDKKVRNFLLFIFQLTSTGSLQKDSFPVAITPSSLSSGSILTTDLANHHTWTVQSFSPAGIPFLIFGSRPAVTSLYTRFEFPTSGFVFPKGLSAITQAGFKNFKQPLDLKTPSLQVPGSSDEQYRLTASLWASTIQRKLATRTEDLNTMAKRILAGTCQSLKERRDIVLQGNKLNLSLGSQCMNAQQYDDYSTPSRDQRFLDQVTVLNDVYQQWKSTSPDELDVETAAKMESLQQGEESALDPNAFCVVEIQTGVPLTLGQMFARLKGKKISSNPMDSIETRWGFSLQPSEKTKRCPKY